MGRWITVYFLSAVALSCGTGTSYEVPAAEETSTTHQALSGTAGSLAVGGFQTCAILPNGTLQCWGGDGSGQLGNGTATSTNFATPISVAGPGTVTAVAGSYNHVCAVLSDATVKCWGYNSTGQVGDPNTVGNNTTTPVAVSGLSGVVSIAAAGYGLTGFTCAVLSNGTVKCWGDNSQGELGNGTLINSTTPVAVSGLSGSAIAVAATAYGACALLSNGKVQCWGNNGEGELGIGTHIGPDHCGVNGANQCSKKAAATISGLSGVTAISAGSGNHTCALLSTGSVACWGYNGSGQIGVDPATGLLQTSPVSVPGLTGVTAVGAGANHSCAVLSDGTARCWGSNASGQLGNGTSTNSFTPVTVSGLSNATAIGGGLGHSCAFLAGATGIRCWGDNTHGQLGNGLTENSATAVAVHNGFDLGDFIAIAAGEFQTCAVLPSGTPQCWGGNMWGQLGNGTATSTNFPLPTTVAGLGTVTAIAGSYNHVCAVLSDTTVKCWGFNITGQVGDPSTVGGNATAPAVVPGLSGVVAIAASGYGLSGFTCAVLSNGTVKCWGDNSQGELGNGTLTNSTAPVAVSGLSGSAVAVAATNFGACALLSNGKVQCWGNNGEGELGIGTNVGPDHCGANGANQCSKKAVTAVSNLSGVTAISAGMGSHTCALLSTGAVKCWGYNGSGQLGVDSSTLEGTTPVTVTGLTGALAIGAGKDHSCAVLSTGAVQCWGSNAHGQLGDGTTNNSSAPVTVLGIASATAVSGGFEHSCALVSGVGIQCWGDNTYGQLGNRTTTSSAVPVFVARPTAAPSPAPVAAGALRTCALLPDGTVQCWGDNSLGELGVGTSVGISSTPVTVSGLSGVTAIAGSDTSMCALMPDQTVKCWGNSLGSTPVAVSGLSGIVAITASGGGTHEHRCALLSNGTVKCWGDNSAGQLGNGTTTNSTTPVAVGLSGVVAVAARELGTCALLIDGTVRCWGDNTFGELGIGTATGPVACGSNQCSKTPAAAVSGLGGGVVAIASGDGFHTCALRSDGAVLCWGNNASGQLGDGTTTNRPAPVLVSGLSGVAAIAAGASHTCAMLSTRDVRCWGSNAHGQLGDGNTTDSPTPMAVAAVVNAAAISAGGMHTCAQLRAGAGIRCWGDDGKGQLGDGLTTNSSTIVPVAGLTQSGIAQVITGHAPAPTYTVDDLVLQSFVRTAININFIAPYTEVNRPPCGERGGLCCVSDLDGPKDFYTECDAQETPFNVAGSCVCGASCGLQGSLACATTYAPDGPVLTDREACNTGLFSVFDPTTHEGGICESCDNYNIVVSDARVPDPTWIGKALCFTVSDLEPLIPYSIAAYTQDGTPVDAFISSPTGPETTPAGKYGCIYGATANGLSPSTTYTLKFVPGGLPSAAWSCPAEVWTETTPPLPTCVPSGKPRGFGICCSGETDTSGICMSPPPPPCVPNGEAKGSGQCCSGFSISDIMPNGQTVAICRIKDPPNCGIKAVLPFAPCCFNSTACEADWTCIATPNALGYAYCAPPPMGNPPNPPPAQQQTGGAACPLMSCLVWCGTCTDLDCKPAGLWCASSLVETNYNNLYAGEDCSDCIACCGPECSDVTTLGGLYCHPGGAFNP